MAQDKWPFPPQVLDTVLLGSTSTASTTGADLYGGGVAKPMGLGPGLILITSHLIVVHSNNNRRVDFRMQVSQDGASWVDADPGTGFPWYNNQLNNGGTFNHIDITFAFAKTQHAQQYAKVQWKTDNNTVSLQAFAADGWASVFRMLKLPDLDGPVNEPKKPYRAPAVRSTYEGVIPAHPPPPKLLEPPARAWTVATWLIVIGALVAGACGGAMGASLAWFAKGAVP